MGYVLLGFGNIRKKSSHNRTVIRKLAGTDNLSANGSNSYRDYGVAVGNTCREIQVPAEAPGVGGEPREAVSL